jgi:D-sedoheptulose 7-phosphate isomerase
MNREQQELLRAVFAQTPALAHLEGDLLRALALLKAAYDGGGKVMVCGNGGSAADSAHIVGELMKGFLKKRPLPEGERARIRATPEMPEGFETHLQRALPALDLTSQSALISAFANDVSADMVYAQQVYGYGAPGDVLLALSTSGNSQNVVNAVHAARAKGVRCVAITGNGESALSRLCDVCLRAPARETYRVQEYTLPLYHALCALIELEYFPE